MNARPVLPVLAAFALIGCNREPEGLNGIWIGQNFQCPLGASHEEEVKVTDEGDRVQALKLTGDDCVPAGELTFHGSRENLSCVVGVPGSPASATWQGMLVEVDANTFEACGIRFVRKPKEA